MIQSVLDTLKKKKRKKQSPFRLEWEAEANRELFWPFCATSKESKTKKKIELQLERYSLNEEIKKNTVRV